MIGSGQLGRLGNLGQVVRPLVSEGADPLLKPHGTRTINLADPLTEDLIQYHFDTGEGEYIILADCSPEHVMVPPAVPGVDAPGGSGAFGSVIHPFSGLPQIVTNVYGTMFEFPGISADESQMAGFWSWVWDSFQPPPYDDIRVAQNLKDKTTGAGVTIGAWFIVKGANVNGPVIAGRTANGFNEGRGAPSPTPGSSLCLSLDSGLKPVGNYYRDGQVTDSVLGGPSDLALDVLHSLFLTFENTAPGVADGKLVLDGSVINTVSGVALADTIGNESAEGQWMIGSSPHVYANHISNVFYGCIPADALWKRSLSLEEMQTLTTEPWRFIV